MAAVTSRANDPTRPLAHDVKAAILGDTFKISPPYDMQAGNLVEDK